MLRVEDPITRIEVRVREIKGPQTSLLGIVLKSPAPEEHHAVMLRVIRGCDDDRDDAAMECAGCTVGSEDKNPEQSRHCRRHAQKDCGAPGVRTIRKGARRNEGQRNHDGQHETDGNRPRPQQYFKRVYATPFDNHRAEIVVQPADEQAGPWEQPCREDPKIEVPRGLP